MEEIKLEKVPYYYQAVDYDKLVTEYPPAPAFLEGVFKLSPPEIRALQERRLVEAVDRAWQVPFCRRKWEAVGLEPGEISSLADLRKLPTYTVDDIRQSIEDHPPFGDYLGLDPTSGDAPMRLHSSGGTTGDPRPTFYTPWDREVGNILRARSYYFHGLRPGDMVLNTLLYSTHNAAFAAHEALSHWLGCTPLSTSAGNVTRTSRALELAQKWGVNCIIGFPEYLMHMAQTAKEMGMEVGRDLKLKHLEAFGKSDLVSEAWGCPAYDTYGMHEVQAMSFECPYGGGHHIFEDAFIVEVVDPETYEPVEPGEVGCIIATALYKDAYPVIRYDTKDMTRLWPQGQCACGSWMQKIDPILGRADFMVKLRGVNLWPEGCGAIVATTSGLTGEYYCIVERGNNREEMTLQAEYSPGVTDLDAIQRELDENLRAKLGVRIIVELVPPDSLATLTGAGILPKARRLEDRRNISG
jgi:phenylacetate-CoA ligase